MSKHKRKPPTTITGKPVGEAVTDAVKSTLMQRLNLGSGQGIFDFLRDSAKNLMLNETLAWLEQEKGRSVTVTNVGTSFGNLLQVKFFNADGTEYQYKPKDPNSDTTPG